MLDVLGTSADAALLRPFALAVTEHLTRPPGLTGHPDELAARVVSILLTAIDSGEELPVDELLAHPEVLASFFQNADLLDRHSDEANRVVRLVTEALERAWEANR